MEKKIILFCTNCQGHAISRILSKFSDEFNSKYECIIIENWVLLNKKIDDNNDATNFFYKLLTNIFSGIGI